jgi:Fic family protein
MGSEMRSVTKLSLKLTQNKQKQSKCRKEELSLSYDWHADLFPGVRRTGDKFRVGAWRDDGQGPMQVVSGPIGRHKIHYQSPAAARVESEIRKFLSWLGGNEQEDPLLRAAIAHS